MCLAGSAAGPSARIEGVGDKGIDELTEKAGHGDEVMVFPFPNY
jgi:hypothetical protein